MSTFYDPCNSTVYVYNKTYIFDTLRYKILKKIYKRLEKEMYIADMQKIVNANEKLVKGMKDNECFKFV